MNELMHYGVKGMKWGVRRERNKVQSKVNHANRDLYKFENTQAKSHAKLESSKGYKVMSTQALKNNDKKSSKRYDRLSNTRMKEHEILEKRAEKELTKLMKSKWDAIITAKNIKNGKQYIDELLNVSPNVDRINSYSSKYNDEGNIANIEHLRRLGVNI